MKILEAWNQDRTPDIIWVVLKNDTREHLVDAINFKFDKNNLKPQASLHHVTIYFRPSTNDIENLKKWADNNDLITIKILENCWNEKIQALKVKIFNNKNEEFTLPNKVFHITISADKGIPPKDSNDMLSGKYNSEPFIETVIGKLQFDNF